MFKRFYDVTPEGNWEEKNILNRSKIPERADDLTERELSACRTLLLQAREHRVRPGWDDKVLADWNGLMISAMANAGVVFERPEWIDTARRAFDFIRGEMTGADGRLLHGWRAGRARHPANVDDYANLCRAALALHEATGDDTAALSDPEAWRRSGAKHNGSWLEDWTAWSESRAGELVKPPHMGSRKHPALADAPGEYVFG